MSLNFDTKTPNTKTHAPPAASYVHAEAFENESVALGKDWFFVAPETVVPNPGDYYSFRALKQPLILVRQKDHSLRIFGNHCKHRYMKLLEGSGTCSKIVCPYHAWTYTTDGKLKSAPEISDFPGLEKDKVRLEEVPVLERNGLVFVCVDKDKRTQKTVVATQTKRFTKEIDKAFMGLGGFHDFQNLVPLVRSSNSIWKCNWKLVVENFNESYHLSFAHRNSIGPESPSALVRESRRTIRTEQKPRFAVHYNFSRDNKVNSLKPHGEDSADRAHCQIISLFPNCLLSVSPGSLFWMRVNPLRVNRTEVTWGVSVSTDLIREFDNELESFIADHVGKIETSAIEDRRILEGLQEGVQFETKEHGWLHQRSESQIPRFWQYLASLEAGQP